MALKDIFTMVKADRYTQDGREEIIKAQEAEIKDARRTYQIGEISETTGMQKTANGWRPVKKGAGTPNEKENKPAAQFLGMEPGPDTGAKLSHKDHVDLANEVKANGDNWTAEEIAKEWNLTKGDAEAVKKEIDNISKPAAENAQFSAEDIPEVGQKVTFNWKDKGMTGIKGTVIGFKTINEKTYARIRGEDKSLSPTGEFNVNLQLLKSDGPRLNTNKGKTITGNIEQENGIWEPIYGEPTDAAPRVLTGDTRIRVRK